MTEIIDRIATALAQAEVGYSLRLTRLVDEVSTYTLTYDDGTPSLEFEDNDDAYAHIAAKKRAKAARLVLEAMIAAGDSCVAESVWQDMIDEALAISQAQRSR